MSLAAPQKWGAVRGLGRAARDGAPPWPGGTQSRVNRRAPPSASRALSSSGAARASQRNTGQVLNRKFLGILRNVVVPVLKGAYLPFTSATTNAATNCAHLARTPFKPAFHGARFYGAPVRAQVRPSTSVPALKPSLAHGPGLQSARNFSSGGAGGGRLFGDIVTNAPLAFRAAADELDDDFALFGSASNLAQSSRAKTTLARAHRGTRRSSPVSRAKQQSQLSTQIGVKYASAQHKTTSSLSPLEGNSTRIEKEDIRATYEQYFAVAPSSSNNSRSDTCGPYTDKRTILRLPAEPDVELFELVLGPAAMSASSDGETPHPLDRQTLSIIRSYSESAAHHRLLISSLQRLLERQGLDPLWTVAPDEDALHGRAFDVSFDGWRAEDVRAMLLIEFGPRRGQELCAFLFEQERASPRGFAQRAAHGSPILRSARHLYSPPQSSSPIGAALDPDFSPSLSYPSSASPLSDAHDLALDVADFGVASQVSFQDHGETCLEPWQAGSSSSSFAIADRAVDNALGMELVMPTIEVGLETSDASRNSHSYSPSTSPTSSGTLSSLAEDSQDLDLSRESQHGHV